MEHSHVMGGSTAARRINCLGSYLAEKTAPEPPDSPFATRGSMLHAAMELILTENPMDMDATEPLFVELLGQDMGFEGHEITVDLVDLKLRPAMQAWFELVEEYDIDDWFLEQRVSLEAVIPGAFGTTDLFAKDTAKRLHSLDWKFGDGVVVEVEGNMGSGFYTAAALYDPEPELIEFCKDIDDVVYMHIVQPRAGADEVLHTWETTIDWVEDFVDIAEKAMKVAVKPDAPRKAGKWCGFCKAQVDCSIYTEMGCDALGKEPKTMTSVALGAAIDQARLLEKWCAAVFKRGTEELEAGASVPGSKLVAKRATRQYTDENAVEAILKKRKAKVADMYNRKLKTPAQMEKSLPAIYKKVIAPLVVKKSSGLTLVADSDKRPAVNNSMGLLANAMENAGKTTH